MGNFVAHQSLKSAIDLNQCRGGKKMAPLSMISFKYENAVPQRVTEVISLLDYDNGFARTVQ
jgi:hypothetical protein